MQRINTAKPPPAIRSEAALIFYLINGRIESGNLNGVAPLEELGLVDAHFTLKAGKGDNPESIAALAESAVIEEGIAINFLFVGDCLTTTCS